MSTASMSDGSNPQLLERKKLNEYLFVRAAKSYPRHLNSGESQDSAKALSQLQAGLEWIAQDEGCISIFFRVEVGRKPGAEPVLLKAGIASSSKSCDDDAWHKISRRKCGCSMVIIWQERKEKWLPNTELKPKNHLKNEPLSIGSHPISGGYLK